MDKMCFEDAMYALFQGKKIRNMRWLNKHYLIFKHGKVFNEEGTIPNFFYSLS